MTYREAIALGERILSEAGIVDAKNDSWLLLANACKIDYTYYYVHIDEDMLEEQVNEFRSLITKRAERVPLQYITGEQEFMGMLFHVNDSVLIPRQDTETLVEEALKIIQPGMSILDMCTGSGCILISLLKNSVDTTGVGVDISKQALNVAKENAKLNSVVATFERSDLFDNVDGKYDIIVSNPPYIRSDDIPGLMKEVCAFEPYEALDGKEDGLYFYRKIINQCRDYLNENGTILFEIGCDQGADVSKMLDEEGFSNVRVIKDLARNDRVVIGTVNQRID